MRRFILSSFFAILTFAAGLGVTSFSYRFVPAPVSVCQLAQHPELYDGKLVRIEASASEIYGAVIITDDACKGVGAWAVLMTNESLQAGPEAQSFLTGSSSEIHTAEVLVVGRFDQNATMGCFGPRFGIHPSRVELRSPVRSEPPAIQ